MQHKTRILVSAHDLGGANQIIYTYRNRNSVDFALTGPALSVGEELRVNIIDSTSLDLGNYAKLAVSSNAKEQLSDLLLIEAKKNGLATIGYLDHWVNLHKRWNLTPSKVIATDAWAFSAAITYYGFRARLAKNYYLEATKNRYLAYQKINSLPYLNNLLLIMQPIRNQYSHSIRLDDCFCSSLVRYMKSTPHSSLTFREHLQTPSWECREYVQEIFPDVPIHVTSWSDDLSIDLFAASTVIGFDTYALYLAKQIGKNVRCFEKPRAWLSPRYSLSYK